MMIKLRGNESDTLYSVLEEELSHLEYDEKELVCDEKELVCDEVDTGGDVIEDTRLVVALRDPDHVGTVYVKEFENVNTKNDDTQKPEIMDDGDTQILPGNEDETPINEDETLRTMEDDLAIKQDDLHVEDNNLHTKHDDIEMSQAESVVESVCLYVESQGY
jgi:hypothetical protein